MPAVSPRRSAIRSIVPTAAMALIACGLAADRAEAATTYTSAASFLANLAPNSHSEDFSSRTGAVYTSVTFTNGTYSATGTTGAQALLVFALSGNNYLTTSTSTSGFSAPVHLALSSNVTAIGGSFFKTGVAGNVVGGNIQLNFSDGSSHTLSGQSNSSFFGYISDTPITSLTIIPDASHHFVSLDNLRFGAAIPAPHAALAPLAGVLLCGPRRRPRRDASN